MSNQHIRPNTPLLDQARAEQEALAKFEQDEQEHQKRLREEAPARAKAAAAQREHLKRCYGVCQEASADAQRAVRELIAALDRYVAHGGNHNRVQNFLAAHLATYRPIESHGPDSSLMNKLFPKEVTNA